jgi:hypothetical protein
MSNLVGFQIEDSEDEVIEAYVTNWLKLEAQAPVQQT